MAVFLLAVSLLCGFDGRQVVACRPRIGSPSRVLLAAGDIFDSAFALSFGGALFGAAIGSVVRDRVVHVARTRFLRADLGVLVVNLVACAVVAATVLAPRELHGLLVLGFAGGLSTWSSLAVDVAGMIRERRWGRVALHLPIACACALAIVLTIEQFARGGYGP